MTKEDLIHYLKRIPLLADLSKKELLEILKFSQKVEFKKSNTIFHEGTVGDEVYLIIKGKIKIFTKSNNKTKLLGILTEGDFLGEMAIIESEYRSATAECFENVEAVMIKSKRFLEFACNDPQISLKIMRTLSRRLREANEEIKNYSFYDLAGRLAHIIISLYKKFYAEKNGEYYINIKITHSELADMLSTARESVTKLLSNFKKSGAIEYKKGYIYIKDMNELRSWIR